MGEKRMLILPAETVKKIDENRGEMSHAEFIEFLIESQFKKGEKPKEPEYATKEELYAVQQDMKQLLKSFLDFFVTYGLELGKRSPKAEFEELTSKLEGLQKDLGTDSEKGRVTLRWK